MNEEVRAMTIATQVYLKLHRLSHEQQIQVLEFVENLEPTPKKPLVDFHGALADARADLSFEEFKKNRQEMWGESTDKDLE
jgi:hypothetical protein